MGAITTDFKMDIGLQQIGVQKWFFPSFCIISFAEDAEDYCVPEQETTHEGFISYEAWKGREFIESFIHLQFK